MDPRFVIHKGGRHDENYLNYIRDMSCLICGAPPRVEPNHVFTRADDYGTFPVCTSCHTASKKAYHVIEYNEFERAHNINILWEVYNLLSAYTWDLKLRLKGKR